MIKKVLFPVIFTEHTEQIVNCLGGLAKNGVEEVLLFHVTSISDVANGKVNQEFDEQILIKWKELLEITGIKVSYKITTGVPWVEIIDLSERGQFSFILIGSHGNYFLDRVLLGSVTENVVHHSRIPVFVFKIFEEDKENPIKAPFCIDVFRRILYATDFSEVSQECIPYIENMKNESNQELDIIHIQDLRNLKYIPEDKMEDFNQTDLIRLNELKERFIKKGFKKVNTILKTGYSITEIMNHSKNFKSTILVFGKKGKSDLKEMLMGGVAQTLIYKSEIPVFVVEGNSK